MLDRHTPKVAATPIVVVIPIWRTDLSDVERQRVTVTALAARNDALFFVHPRSLDVHFYREVWPEATYLAFDNSNFVSRSSYNSWILTPDLYRTLHNFDYLLLTQTDALLTRLPDVGLIESYDFCGASWDPSLRVVRGFNNRLFSTHSTFGVGSKLHVGNGGISIRRTSVFAKTHFLPKHNPRVNEDVHISYFGRRCERVRIAPREIADTIFAESSARKMTLEEAKNIYGFHALSIYNPNLEFELLADLLGPGNASD